MEKPSDGGRDGARLFAGDAIGTDVFAAPPHPVFAAESAEITLRSGTLFAERDEVLIAVQSHQIEQ